MTVHDGISIRNPIFITNTPKQYAGRPGHYFSFYRWLCLRQFLRSIQKSERVELGKLLDHWWSILLVDYSADRGLVNGSTFFIHYFTNVFSYFLVDLFLGRAVGDRRFNVRFRNAVPRYVAG